MSPFLVVLSSPSGGGKSTIARRILDQRPELGYSVSATTRAPRNGERDGTHYHFLTEKEFRRRRDAGAFLEWATYAGHLYGTLEEEVERILRSGRNVLMDIEVNGARHIRERRSDVVSIFLLPPSAEVLAARLREREGDDTPAVRERLLAAVEELDEAVAYDYCVVNDELDAAVRAVHAILDAEERRTRRLDGLDTTLAGLREGLKRAAVAAAGK